MIEPIGHVNSRTVARGAQHLWQARSERPAELLSTEASARRSAHGSGLSLAWCQRRCRHGRRGV